MQLQKELITRMKEAALLVFLLLFLFSFPGRSSRHSDVKHTSKHQHAKLVKKQLAVISRLQVSLTKPGLQKIPVLLQSNNFTPENTHTNSLFVGTLDSSELREQNTCRFYYRLFSLSGEEPA